MLLKHSLVLLFCFWLSFLCAQTKQQKTNTLKTKLQKDSLYCYRFKKVRPFVSLDNRHSFIKDAPVNVNGLQVGIRLYDKHMVGLGLYGLQKNAKQKLYSTNENNVVAIRSLKLNYLTTFYQYVIIDKRFFQLDLPLEIGLGSYRLTLLDTLTKNPIAPETKGGIFIIAGGASITLKPVKWIGLTGTAGYRTALDGNPNLNFSGAFYSYGVWIDLRQIYRDIKYYGFICKKHKQQMKEIDLN